MLLSQHLEVFSMCTQNYLPSKLKQHQLTHRDVVDEENTIVKTYDFQHIFIGKTAGRNLTNIILDFIVICEILEYCF